MVNRNSKESKEHVLKMAKEHNVKFIRLWFTDILGFLKSFAITVEELEGALEEGMGFDGSSIEGLPVSMKAIWWLYLTLIPSSYFHGDPRNIML